LLICPSGKISLIRFNKFKIPATAVCSRRISLAASDAIRGQSAAMRLHRFVALARCVPPPLDELF
jgi:hypothetical protein